MKWARWLLIALVVLNVGYFAWSTGALALFGMVPAALSEREPQRMAWQIRPEALQIRKESEVAAPPAAATPNPAPETGAQKTDHEGL